MLRQNFRHVCVSALGLMSLMSLPSHAQLSDYERSKPSEVWTPVPPEVATPDNKAPSDAIILFDGSNLDAWKSNSDGPAPWKIVKGKMVIAPGTGDLHTKASFCDVQLHIEWKTLAKITDEKGHQLDGQDRSNSGIYFQERYELQVLDSYHNPTYVNGQAGSIYKEASPLVNASRGPGQWQSYDVIYSAPKFDASGKLIKSGRITVLQNGVLVQNNTEITGPTSWIGHPPYVAHGCAPLELQDHGHAVEFKNIWIRNLE